jgi:cytochrome c5
MRSAVSVASLLLLMATSVFAADEVVEKQIDEKPVSAVDASVDESAAEREAWAKNLFEGRCQMCHQLPEPGMLKPQQWKLILMTMQQRMQQAGVPSLTEDETERLLEYLAERAR